MISLPHISFSLFVCSYYSAPNDLRNLPGACDQRPVQQGILAAPSRRLEHSDSRVRVDAGLAGWIPMTFSLMKMSTLPVMQENNDHSASMMFFTSQGLSDWLACLRIVSIIQTPE
jgi:hypothetical protein